MNLDDPVMFYHLLRKSVAQQSQVYHQFTQLLAAFEKTLTKDQIDSYREMENAQGIPKASEALTEAMKARTDKVNQRQQQRGISDPHPASEIELTAEGAVPRIEGEAMVQHAETLSREALARLGIVVPAEALTSYLQGDSTPEALAEAMQATTSDAGWVAGTPSTAPAPDELPAAIASQPLPDHDGPGEPRGLHTPPLENKAQEMSLQQVKLQLYSHQGILAKYFSGAFYPAAKGRLKPSLVAGHKIREYPSNLLAIKPEKIVKWPSGFYVGENGQPQFLLNLKEYMVFWQIGPQAQVDAMVTHLVHKSTQRYQTLEQLVGSVFVPLLAEIDATMKSYAELC